MKSFATEDTGRIIIISLQKGEKILESIEQELKKWGIENAVMLSGVGSLRKVSYHYIENTNDWPTNKFIVADRPIELAAIQGMVLNGVPHLHIVSSDMDNYFVGHLENGCEVQYLAEILLLEIKNPEIVRKFDEFGISYLDEA